MEMFLSMLGIFWQSLFSVVLKFRGKKVGKKRAVVGWKPLV